MAARLYTYAGVLASSASFGKGRLSQQTHSPPAELPLAFFQEKCGVNVAGSTNETFLPCGCPAPALIVPSAPPASGRPPAARCPRNNPPRAKQYRPAPQRILHAVLRSAFATGPSQKTIPRYWSSPLSRPNETPECLRAPA